MSEMTKTEAGNKIANAKDAQKMIEESVDKFKVEAEENGWDLDYAEEFEIEPPKTPKFRIYRRLTVGLAMEANKIAKICFAPEGADGTWAPDFYQSVASKLSLIAKFDDKVWNVEDIKGLPVDFLQQIALIYSKLLA